MNLEQKNARMLEIEECAYEVLVKRGYAGTSMLAVAQKAKASNETMYKWYRSKHGLFVSLIQRHSFSMRLLLEQSLKRNDKPIEALKKLAPVLLSASLGERIILLNRAAASDLSGKLGEVIAREWRAWIAPIIGNVIARMLPPNSSMNRHDAMEVFIHLLLGDRQARRMIGVLSEPSEAEIQKISQQAINDFSALIGLRS